MQIAGKVILITGGSGGIGAACAKAFRERGAKLSLTARSADRLQALAGDETLVTPGDITDPETRRRVVDRTLERFGQIDILINNAGVGLYCPSWKAAEPEVRQMFEVNFFAALWLTQLVVPHMQERRSGMIVTVSSIAGRIPLPWFTLYSATKYACGCFTEGLRMELRRYGIRTMTVCPGYAKTGFQDAVLLGEPPEQVQGGKKYFAVTAEECAAAIVRGVERDARTVMTPAIGWLVVAFHRLFPSISEAVMARVNERGPA